MNVHRVNAIRQTELQTTEQLQRDARTLEFELAKENAKKAKQFHYRPEEALTVPRG